MKTEKITRLSEEIAGLENALRSAKANLNDWTLRRTTLDQQRQKFMSGLFETGITQADSEKALTDQYLINEHNIAAAERLIAQYEKDRTAKEAEFTAEVKAQAKTAPAARETIETLDAEAAKLDKATKAFKRALDGFTETAGGLPEDLVANILEAHGLAPLALRGYTEQPGLNYDPKNRALRGFARHVETIKGDKFQGVTFTPALTAANYVKQNVTRQLAANLEMIEQAAHALEVENAD